jgi:hypothetical protein
MRNKSEEYRRSAAECLRVAEQTADPTAKAELIAMARSWIALAAQAERNSQADIVYETPPPAQQEQPVAQQQQQIQPDKEKKD